LPPREAIGRSTSGRAASQAAMITTSETAKIQKPAHDPSSREANMWFRLRSAPVAKTSVTCTMMNSTKYSITGKWIARASWTG
jgi:hypothetical protein